ncbi:efflux RND transporter permease subunit [Desulfococcus multivorans]|uniref:Acriflavin resistance protein n=1 Tax=Desulfococcus multivorans DSM 2059 TaxID=1121405 RepID=S7V669_DESML|nr:efflux RND transporter permease subunit [Desulfococcus multivorans]AOY59391.1 AcrB: predicted acriflavine resistance protein [Desulfococcus multivorans]AQV01602.1 multidrug efflux protein [Desulfococcus multivorans]EPR42144.1 acriflavin resistance protein [Desulfococcus multivorans DSM 2059]SJZ99825.1 multidrug efflux pump [Desulfococcus multivorans DSM 2059]
MRAFTDIFIHRPVLSLVVSFLIIIAGLQALRTVNVRQYPRSENAAVTIMTVYVGADADLVRGFITTPIERAVAAADGIEYIESKSAQGLSTITVRLKLNYDPVKALSEISAKVDQVRGDLPPEAEVPIINVESADSQFASAYLSFTSDILEQNEITDYLVRVVQPRLSAVEGVQRADILGARTFAMRVWLKPERMAALNISPGQVREALAANNFLSAVGETKGSLVQVNLVSNTDMSTVEEFKRLVIREQDGAIVRLEDVGEVELGAEDYDAEVRFSGQTAVFMGIWPLPNANSIDVIQRVTREMADIDRQLPTGMAARVAYDATDYITNAIREVVKTLAETLIIVVVIIFLFLGSLRSVLIPVVTIPMSLIGAIFLMQVFGFTINLLTLLAIVLSVGLVVDDSIVMVENIERHLSEGESPMDAALAGARELISPVIATTIILVAVYAPIGLQGGLTGSLFREFAFTLTGAVIISTVIALTLSPMMASKLLKPGMKERGLADRISRGFDRFRGIYGKLLDVTLDTRPAVYTVWLIVSLLTVPMFIMSPAELAPTEDQGVIFGILDASANSTLDQNSQYAAAVNDVFFSIPETNFTFQITQPNSGFAGMVLKPWEERDRTVFQVMPEVQEKLSAIPGIRIFPVTPAALPGGGDFPVEFLLTATAETEQILELANQIQYKAMQSGMFAFPPIIDVKIDQPQSEIVIDRDKTADLGLDLQQVGSDLAAMLSGNYVNRFNIAGRSYKVIPQVTRVDRLNPEQLLDIHVSGPDGRLVPLSTIATIKNTTTPRSLNRFQQLNAVKISGVPVRPLDEALKFLEAEAAAILPQGYVIDYTGESRQLRTEGNKFIQAFVLAVVLIFLTLAAQFNSFRDTFVILAGSVPLGMFGALIFTFLKMPDPNVPFWTQGWTTTLNIYSQVGLVTLVGLVAKNGILVVEFANKLQLRGMDKREAVREAALTRFRPVLMTTGSTIAGYFPLILVTGAGAEARNSIGLVLVGGMTVGTFFTLFVIPSIYMLVARDHAKTAGSAVEAAA